MDLKAIFAKYNLKPKGVIQVGSHHGEEIPLWKELGLAQIHFEPSRINYLKMMLEHPDALIFPVALGNLNCVRKMYCETVNGGQSNSLLQPKEHLRLLPWIKFDSTEDVVVMRLDEFNTGWCDFLFIDAQGYEMEVLHGAFKTLDHIEAILVEVNRAELFEGCSQIDDVDTFLHGRGFKRVEVEWHGGDFGDAFYVRR